MRTLAGDITTKTCENDADCGANAFCAMWQGLGPPVYYCHPGRPFPSFGPSRKPTVAAAAPAPAQ